MFELRLRDRTEKSEFTCLDEKAVEESEKKTKVKSIKRQLIKNSSQLVKKRLGEFEQGRSSTTSVFLFVKTNDLI